MGISMEDLERILRTYLSTGLAIVVVIIGPAVEGGGGPGGIPGPDGAVVTVQPDGTLTNPDGEPVEIPSGTDEPGRGGPSPGDEAPSGAGEPDADDPDTRFPGTTGSGDATTGTGTDGTDPGPSGDVGSGSTGRGDADPGGTGDAGRDRSGTGVVDTDGDGLDAGAATDPRPTADDGITAAETLGWGAPSRSEDFDGDLDGWSVYEGPGYAGNGERSPSALTVADGVLSITGDRAGTTGGLCRLPGREYGRWEGRVRAPEADPSHHALLLLWPDSEDHPSDGEIDFMEMTDPDRQETGFFLHHGADNSLVDARVRVDGTQWHNWAVDWSPDAIVGYVDGEEWFRATDPATFPPGPMHLCIQLDWFPSGDAVPQESVMHVDWVREYPVDAAGPDRGGPGTGSADPDGAGPDGSGPAGRAPDSGDPGSEDPGSRDPGSEDPGGDTDADETGYAGAGSSGSGVAQDRAPDPTVRGIARRER